MLPAPSHFLNYFTPVLHELILQAKPYHDFICSIETRTETHTEKENGTVYLTSPSASVEQKTWWCPVSYRVLKGEGAGREGVRGAGQCRGEGAGLGRSNGEE